MNAHTKITREAGSLKGWINKTSEPDQAMRLAPVTLEDGSLVIPPAKLARFGGGDVAKGRNELKALLEAEHDRKIRTGPATRPANVRIATEADEPAIMDLLMVNVRENAAVIAVPDPDRILLNIQLGTRQRGNIVAVIDGPDKKPVAVTILTPMQWWWSREWYFQELVNFVHPDHRKSRHIHDLIEFQRWCVDAQTKNFGHRVFLLCGVLGLHRVRSKIILYRRKLRQHGAAFLYPSPFGDEAEMT